MRPIALSALFALSAALAAPAHSITLGQIDAFESGTTEGWFAGGGPMGGVPPVPPTVIGDGGPGGAGDAYLQLSSNGSAAAGGRLVGMNLSQWAGNYLASGVTGIEMDLRNFGNTDLSLRLFFEDPLPGPPVNTAVTSFAATLAAGSDWTRVLFPVTADDFALLTGDLTTLLGNTTLIRIFHGTGAAFPGEPIAALLGVDNIEAVGGQVGEVPEPASLALLLAGLAAASARGVKRRRVREG